MSDLIGPEGPIPMEVIISVRCEACPDGITRVVLSGCMPVVLLSAGQAIALGHELARGGLIAAGVPIADIDHAESSKG